MAALQNDIDIERHEMNEFNLSKLDHLNLAVCDVQQSIKFYTPTLKIIEIDELIMVQPYSNNGNPGGRPEYHPGYHGAFALDSDGINIEAIFHD